jgi:hypothetical protein
MNKEKIILYRQIKTYFKGFILGYIDIVFVIIHEDGEINVVSFWL